MSKELNEDTAFKVSIKTLIGIAFAIATIVGMWFALQADIEEAKELPVAPVIAGDVLQLPSVEHHVQPEESDHVQAIA